MFFQKKSTKKIDPKIRFQQDSFTKQVANARNYKRQARTIPETSFQKFLFSIGLDSWPRKIGVLLFVALLVYLVYIPNFLSVRHIVVNGVADSDIASVQESVRQYMATRSVFPQRNLFFLRNRNLSTYLEQHNDKVLEVVSIDKKYLNTINLTVKPQLNTFTLQTNRGSYVVDNGGVVVSELTPGEQGVVEVKGVIVKAPSESIFAIGKKYVSPSFVSAIRMVRKVFPEIVKYGIDSIIVKPPVKTPDKTEDSTADPPDKKLVTEQPAPLFTISEEAPLTPREFTLVARGTNGSAVYSFEVIFDIETDMTERMQKLSLLLQQFPEEKRRTIKYVDMRFDNKGFVCFNGTACANEAQPAPAEP